MKVTRDIENKTVAEINGYTIIRSVAKEYDWITDELKGHKQVWYDVCDEDMDLLESFKTLKKAKAFCKVGY